MKSMRDRLKLEKTVAVQQGDRFEIGVGMTELGLLLHGAGLAMLSSPGNDSVYRLICVWAQLPYLLVLQFD